MSSRFFLGGLIEKHNYVPIFMSFSDWSFLGSLRKIRKNCRLPKLLLFRFPRFFSDEFVISLLYKKACKLHGKRKSKLFLLSSTILTWEKPWGIIYFSTLIISSSLLWPRDANFGGGEINFPWQWMKVFMHAAKQFPVIERRHFVHSGKATIKFYQNKKILFVGTTK